MYSRNVNGLSVEEEYTMKVGIMQPYFAPYIGYWQLMNAVDEYVIYDDVTYINRGWINRNRILVEGTPQYISIPLSNASQNKKINEIELNFTTKLVKKNLKTIEYSYKKAPYYQDVFPLVKKIMECSDKRLVSYIENSFYIICNYLNIETEFVFSSSLDKNCHLKGQEKIIDICQLLNASEYYNAIGGQNLYNYEVFKNRNIRLKFLKTQSIKYTQFKNEFQPDLSIIDVMMFNSKEKVQRFLTMYDLIEDKRIVGNKHLNCLGIGTEN